MVPLSCCCSLPLPTLNACPAYEKVDSKNRVEQLSPFFQSVVLLPPITEKERIEGESSCHLGVMAIFGDGVRKE